MIHSLLLPTTSIFIFTSQKIKLQIRPIRSPLIYLLPIYHPTHNIIPISGISMVTANVIHQKFGPLKLKNQTNSIPFRGWGEGGEFGG